MNTGDLILNSRQHILFTEFLGTLNHFVSVVCLLQMSKASPRTKTSSLLPASPILWRKLNRTASSRVRLPSPNSVPKVYQATLNWSPRASWRTPDPTAKPWAPGSRSHPPESTIVMVETRSRTIWWTSAPVPVSPCPVTTLWPTGSRSAWVPPAATHPPPGIRRTSRPGLPPAFHPATAKWLENFARDSKASTRVPLEPVRELLRKAAWPRTAAWGRALLRPGPAHAPPPLYANAPTTCTETWCRWPVRAARRPTVATKSITPTITAPITSQGSWMGSASPKLVPFLPKSWRPTSRPTRFTQRTTLRVTWCHVTRIWRLNLALNRSS